MTGALQAVQNGSPVAEAARRFGVPRVTLMYRFKGKIPVERKMGPSSYLNKNEEETLVKWVMECATTGFPVTKEQLLNSVQHLVIKLKRNTPFKNNRPGRYWIKLFLKRHPELSE